LIFRKATIAHDKGKPAARQGRKAVNLLGRWQKSAIFWRLSGCRKQSEKAVNYKSLTIERSMSVQPGDTKAS
jgi:hypothetical protein